jgi:hypothetical protein
MLIPGRHAARGFSFGVTEDGQVWPAYERIGS